MNDVRNLMQTLAGDIKYREFQNFGRRTPEAPRGGGQAGGLRLGAYLQAASAQTTAADLRRLPLDEVFARLARRGPTTAG